MTIGDNAFGRLNVTLMLAAVAGLTLFLVSEARVASPLIHLGKFRDPILSAGLITSALVSTVLMATLVVGPFHLSGALQLDPASVGLVMSIGPLVAAVLSAAAGRVVDRLGATRMIHLGLIGVLAGALGLASMPVELGVPGYVAPLVVITASYALFKPPTTQASCRRSARTSEGLSPAC